MATGAEGLVIDGERVPSAEGRTSGVGKELGMEGLVHNTELESVFLSTEA